MRMELTKSDILLLKLSLSALILFAFVRLLIMPGIGRYQENVIQAELLEDTMVELSALMDSVPQLERSIEVRRAAIEEASSPYYAAMGNRQIDELLTGLALRHGLFPVSLSIEGAAPAIPEAYLYGVTAQSDRIPWESYMLTALGNLTLRGEEAKIFAFLDDVEKNYPAVQVRSLRMDERVYFDADWNVVEQPDVECVLAVYMYDQSVTE